MKSKKYTGPSQVEIDRQRHLDRLIQANLEVNKDFEAVCYERLVGYRDSAKLSLDNWKKRFENDPFDAFRWSNEIMRAAARYSIFRDYARDMITRRANGEAISIKMIHDDLLNQVNNRSWRIEQSTSPTSNLCEDYLRVEFAEIARLVGVWIQTRTDAICLLYLESEKIEFPS